MLTDRMQTQIVNRALLRIGQHGITFEQPPEQLPVARVLVVRMVTLGQNPIDAMNGLRIRFRTQLQQFVVVRVAIRLGADSRFQFDSNSVIPCRTLVAAGHPRRYRFRSSHVDIGNHRPR